MIYLADRKVVGWSLSEDMTIENTVKSAWLDALKNELLLMDLYFILIEVYNMRPCKWQNTLYLTER